MPDPTYGAMPVVEGGGDAGKPEPSYRACPSDGTDFVFSAGLFRCTNGHAYEIFVVGTTERVVYHGITDGIASTSLAVLNNTVNASRGAVTAGTGAENRDDIVAATTSYATKVT